MTDNKPTPVPKEISRANQHDVAIRWDDGHQSVYPARMLRLACPCAACVDEMTGQRTLVETSIAPDVHPLGIDVVGRYAIQLRWSDGHSTGIYSFGMLRKNCPCSKCTGKPEEASAAPAIVEIPEPGEHGGISGTSSMADVLAAYPSAQRALFRRYHIGGCSSCGFQPHERLEEVCARKGITDVSEVIEFVVHSDAADKRLQIAPRDVYTRMNGGEAVKLIDVRQPTEWEAVHINGAIHVSEQLMNEMENWPKDSPIVFYCHRGDRSLDAAAYFAGHGFTNVKSMRGGIDAWSRDVEPTLPRYEVEATGHQHSGHLRPV